MIKKKTMSRETRLKLHLMNPEYGIWEYEM